MTTSPDINLFGVTFVLYPTDILVWCSVLAIILSSFFAMRKVFWQQAFRKVVSDGKAVWCFGMLVLLVSISLVDSIHFKNSDDADYKAGENISLLDKMCMDLISQPEQSYSAPMANKLFTKRVVRTEDGIVKDHPPLAYGGRNYDGPEEGYPTYVKKNVFVSLFIGGLWGLLPAVLTIWLTNMGRRRLNYDGKLKREAVVGVVLFWVTSCAIAVGTVLLSKEFHVFGTDKVGISTLWTSLKSYRTAFIIGSLTTIIAAVPAVVFGLLAGYLRGWVDDAVQYVYTTLSSIPNILLIGAAMLIVQTSLSSASSETVADQSMLYLCLVLGLTSWAGLCRLVRGEVMKLRDIEYVQAARAMGLSKHAIMWRHLFPNVMHIILINMVLRFSALILTEAVLAYIGIGVHPSTQSFGNMIVSAQEQLSRDPVIWWNLIAAFVFLLALVIPANLFGDAVRDALDPRLEEVD